ncbi:MAG: trypsin-like peptidase domain-containing protein [Pirellulales bacterium]|nr:trypsin-like peptidase domain-containing protein [Pirellulales bacterium]
MLDEVKSSLESADVPVAPTSRPVTQQDLSRLRRLLWIFSALLALLITPFLIERVQYSLTAAQERAKYDVARENLSAINLRAISDASRLLAQYVGPSVVNVHTHGRRREGQGSGVIVDKEGYIVTNEHVVRNVRNAEIQLSDGRRGTASVIGADPATDVAVLKTELDNLIPAQWGDSDSLDVGDMVWAIGSPFGLQKSTTFGIVSAKERRGITRGLYQEFLQTDAAVNPGNSGGPLVNVSGEIVGINTAIIGPSYQGISFSIPSAIARDSYQQLRDTGWVLRGFLGVEPTQVSDPIARKLGLDRGQGVLVVRVHPNTPAAEAGLQSGDVILSWNGIEYSDPNLMSRSIAATEIGAVVPVEVMRLESTAPKKLVFQVKVAARPRNPS